MEPESSLPHSQVLTTVPTLSQINPFHVSPSHFLKLTCITCAECQAPFPLLVLHQRINRSSKLCEMFCNIVQFWRWGVFSTTANPQAGGPPLIGCLRLLIQYIRSYPPYLEAVPPSATWGRSMLWWQGPTYRGFRMSLLDKTNKFSLSVV